MSGSDRLAGVIYSVAAELRLRIGRDLAVTGFDGSAAAALMHPRLTTVAIPVDDIAGRVVDRALRQVDHGPDQQPGEVVRARLRLGESTGGFGPEPDRAALSEPDDAALTWKRFQGAVVSAGASGAIAVSPSRTWPPMPGWASARSRAVLNGSDQVRESTMRAVLDSIERLGYRPSHAAAALVRGTPHTVALIVAHMTRPSAVVRVASALAVLEDQGYDTIVCNVDSAAERDRHLEALLPTHRADGVLAICLPLSRGQLGQFARAGVALVSVDAANPGVPQTVVDDVVERAAGGRPPHRPGAPADRLRRRHAPSRARLHLLRGPAARVQASPGRGGHRRRNRPDPAGPARRRRRGRARGATAEIARSPVGDLRRLRHPGHRRAGRGGPAWCGGPRPAVGGRLRRHRIRGLPQPQHDPPAAGPQRDRGRAAAVRAAARGAGPAVAAGTADRADGTGYFGPESASHARSVRALRPGTQRSDLGHQPGRRQLQWRARDSRSGS